MVNRTGENLGIPPLAVVFCLIGFDSTVLLGQVANTELPRMVTRWAANTQLRNVNPEYPRPQLKRLEWLSLNGLWDYGITFRAQTNHGDLPEQILVPFSEESVLSNSKHRLFTERQRLWYRRTFNIQPVWRELRVLLHFEAVDWETTVWLNGKELGTHKGGYDQFTFDITDALKPGAEQELVVSVLDPTDTDSEPRGKQMLHPRPPFFNASSGIWQTVWLEPVPPTHIESLNIVPDIDASVLNLNALVQGNTNELRFEAVVLDRGKQVATGTGSFNTNLILPIPNPELWSPDFPFLYDLKVYMLRDGKKVDEVSSYFGMRKISVSKDGHGFPRLMLNNKRLFQLGPLDQGYWPDGIYAAPTDEALKHDIEVMKKLGFNMVRKHVKVEPDRWYYWCDKLGLLVWQDMPNGGRQASFAQKEIQRSADSARQFETELTNMISQHMNHPSIVMWIAFNQGWGQYDTIRISKLIKGLDPSRLVINASGWHDFGVGDVRSLHRYPSLPKPEHDGIRPYVIGECGGLGLAITNHLWGPMGSWNTIFCNSTDDLTGKYILLISELQQQAQNDGLSGAVITQLTDVETEDNGFMTYDRAVIKMPVEVVKAANERLIKAGSE